MDAWRHTFLFQNSENKHSWFFCFDKQTTPFWFIDWWLYYGPPEDILPPSIYDALITFHKNTENIEHCPIILHFFIHCKLSWIMYWGYAIDESEDTLLTLQRAFWTKWWNNYDLSKCTSQTIIESL
ncbi:hypothetical protein CFOL_v3_21536 [Cephalotus follicularis]|uniref:Uncharacterized protein n=1 Tax=Cephalotus follicularis TaxID=3775 RepID=A0A1Q3CD64_CEPFO|nr:hypothetical protein CFOL_v3_21536 [Cephalotus follicularis]